VRAIAGPLQERPLPPGTPRRIAILSQEKIGDAVLLTPLLAGLHAGLPGTEITVFVNSARPCVLANDRAVRRVVHAKRYLLGMAIGRGWRPFDILFNTKDHASFSFLLYSRVIPARYRVGIYHERHVGFFHHLIRIDFHRHVAEKNCALLDLLGIDSRRHVRRPYLPAGPVAPAIDTCVADLRLRAPLLGINLSAGEPAREWPREKWSDLLRRVGVPAVVLAMPPRQNDKSELERESSHVIATPPTVSIHDAAAIVAALALLVTPDTALVHIGACFDIPVVGLYRATMIHRSRFGPLSTLHRVVVSPSEYVKDIPCDEVAAAVRELWREALVKRDR
jgi:ADP-heptose:LPS heptosyltransferase